jgi:phosphatidylinositol glycan class F
VIPHELIFYIWLVELVKVLVVTYCFPLNYILEFNNAGYSSGNKNSNLPFSRRDGVNQGNQSPIWRNRLAAVCSKVADVIKGLPNFAGGVLLGYVVFVFFGAPLIEKWELTLEFSFILVTWLYFPLILVIHPASVLQELLYISSWKYENSTLSRAKWRFLFVVFGAWLGAVVIPLDWDRPWQRWPTPCLVSSFISMLLIDCLYSTYLLWSAMMKRPDPVSKAFKSPAKRTKHF